MKLWRPPLPQLLVLSAIFLLAPRAPAMTPHIEDIGEPAGTIFVPAGLSLEDVRSVITLSLAQREWTVKERFDNRVVGVLVHRGRDARLTLNFDTEKVDLYCVGWRLNRSGERVRPEQPEGWIKNITKDITERLNLRALTK